MCIHTFTDTNSLTRFEISSNAYSSEKNHINSEMF